MAITTTHLRCWTMLSHSNGFGLAGWVEQLLLLPHLQPVSITDPTQVIWKNIFVFTSAQGFAGPAGTPPTHTIDEGAWLEMTTNNPSSPAAPHPHPSPYAFPNNRFIPLPNWRYDAGFETGVFRGTGTMAGIELELSWLLSNYWQDEIGVFGVCAPGSLFLRYDQGIAASSIFGDYSGVSTPESVVDLSYGYYNWYTPADNFDFAPSTGRLYKAWLDKAIASKAALPTGTTMSIDVVVPWFGDNDANREHERVLSFEDHARKFVRRIRQDLVDNELTNLPADQVRIVWPGVLAHYDGLAMTFPTPQGNPDFINEILQRMEADDPYFRYLDTSGYTTWDDDTGHLDSASYAQAARDIFDLIVEMDVEPYDALDSDELLTVAQMEERIRFYYGRGTSNTDFSGTNGSAILRMHLNGAMHHVLHQCSDYAWWLRRRAPLSLSGGGVNNPITLPKMVHRLLKIESIGDVTVPLMFEMVGHTDGGRLQIVLHNASTGTYNVHFIRMPRDLTRDTELVPIPKMLVEWVVVEACLRAAKAAANPMQVASWAAESQKLMTDVLKNLSATQRAKRDRLYTQRRLPDVLNRNRNQRWGNP